MMDSQLMNNPMVFLELFDQELPNDDSPALTQTTAETEPQTEADKSEGNKGSKAKKRKQSFERTRKDNTEIQTQKTYFYNLDPNNEQSAAKRAKIQKAKKSREFREKKMQEDNLKDDLINQLTAQNKILTQDYLKQLKIKDDTIQQKDKIILQLYHCLVKNGLVR